ncbi:MAG: LolA family protein, partial [Gemmatimonadales bacterium]
ALSPRDPSMPFTEATLWLDRRDALPRRLEIIERSGSRRTLSLDKVRADPRVSSDVFRFTPPAGVRIVDQD